jgi:Tn3 transposase DDE domain
LSNNILTATPTNEIPTTPAAYRRDLTAEVAEYYADPLGFVLWAYPWRKPGPLEQFMGPDLWQVAVLNEIGAEVRKRDFHGFQPVAPLRESIASGHGIGKSTLVAWLVNWIMSTRPGCQGTVTANSILLSGILNRYQAAGNRKALELLKQISPVAWQHIHFLGHYAFRDKQHPIDLEAILACVNLQ